MSLAVCVGFAAGCVVGYFAGRFAARAAADETVIEAQVDRDIANSECALAQAEARRLKALLRGLSPFSVGAGSPWGTSSPDLPEVAE